MNPYDGQHWLTCAKVEAPRQDLQLVERPRLVDQLQAFLEHRLGLVVAPAGFGKTTAIALWRREVIERGGRVGWLTLDEHDADPHQFFIYVVFALARAGIPLGKLEMLAEQGLQDMSVRAGASSLLEAISHHSLPVVLVLDDYHRLQCLAVDTLLSEMLAACPTNFHIVISSRTTPRINIAHLLAAGHAREIGVESLRFTRDETRSAVAAELPEQVLNDLFDRTEGWPVAVQLAKVVVRGSGPDAATIRRFIGTGRYLAAYLADQVLATLPDDVTDFLMRTSILERFNISLANELCGRTDGLKVLDQLDSLRALVVPLDEGGQWFRYHHLFADHLRGLLQRRCPDDAATLYLLASRWFEREGQVAEAVSCAQRARDYARCARLIEAAGGWELILYGGIGFLRNLIRQVPDTEIAAHPRLQLARSYLHMKDGNLDEARALYDAASSNQSEETTTPEFARDLVSLSVLLGGYEDHVATRASIDASAVRENEIPADDAMTRAMLRVQRSLMALAIGEFTYAEDVSKSAMAAMRQAESMLGLNYCYLHAGVSAFYRGLFQSAEAHLWKAQQMAEDNFGADSGLKAIADVLMGALHFWRGDVSTEARRTFRAAVEHVGHHDGWLEIYACALDAQVEMALAEQAVERANDAVGWASAVVERRGLQRLRDLVAANRLRINVRRSGDSMPDATEHGLASAYRPGCWKKNPYLWQPYLAFALAGPLERPHAAANARLDDAIECARSLGARFHLIRLLLHRALVSVRAIRRNDALADLLEALRLAAPEGIRGPFRVSPALKPLLCAAKRTVRADAGDSMLLRFLADCITDADGMDSGNAQVALSPREQEVLQELALGLSNKQIARALDMTEHTVKFHLKNIFSKLGVDRRSLAVEQARNCLKILN
jgi:LuxR family maltose regulon positive regulatory protein